MCGIPIFAASPALSGAVGEIGLARKAAISRKFAENLGSSRLDGGWCSLLRTSLCVQFPDLQGKYREILRFQAQFDVWDVRNCSIYQSFLSKFPKIRNRELF